MNPGGLILEKLAEDVLDDRKVVKEIESEENKSCI